MKTTLICLVLTVLFQSLTFGLNETSKADLFSEGKVLFRQANELAGKNPEKAATLYRRAALRFENIADAGKVKNGRLLYNIGNIYFRLGDLGKAVLYYRRAGKLIPNDANLIQNLSYARNRRPDRFKEPEEKAVLKTLLFWHYDIAQGMRSALFAGCFIAFFVLASIRLIRPATIPRWLLAGVGLITLCLLSSVLFEHYQESSSREGVVISHEVVGRKGDGPNYQPSFKAPLHAGTEFTLLEERNGWFQIELPDLRRCWVPSSTAELL